MADLISAIDNYGHPIDVVSEAEFQQVLADAAKSAEDSDAVLPLIAYNFAAGNRKRTRDSLMVAQAAAVGAALICTVLCLIFAHPLVGALSQIPAPVATTSGKSPQNFCPLPQTAVPLHRQKDIN